MAGINSPGHFLIRLPDQSEDTYIDAFNAGALHNERVCMYVHVYVCMCVCVCICVWRMHCITSGYVCMYMCMHVCMYVCMYVCICVFVCKRMYLCITCMHVCMHICLKFMCVCVNASMYLCVCSNLDSDILYSCTAACICVGHTKVEANHPCQRCVRPSRQSRDRKIEILNV